MGQGSSKNESTIDNNVHTNSVHSQRRKKGKRPNSRRIDLNSINGMESYRNIDNVLSEMGVKSTIDIASESGIIDSLFLYI